MENCSRNLFSVVCVLVAAVFSSAVCDASEKHQPDLSWLYLLDQSYGPTESRCGLGFVGFGTPMLVTRVSSWARSGGLTEADTVLTANGIEIHSDADLTAAVKSLGPHDPVTISVLRDGDVINVRTACRDATSVLAARANALDGAAEGRWEDCIGATYREEFFWGGATSESAGLRLWCHRAQDDQAGLTRLDAQFLYEHTTLLLEEYRFVPGWVQLNMTGFTDRIEVISGSGHIELSTALQAKLERIDDH